jgi:hypothetical protein
MKNALRLWAVWEGGGPLAETRTEVVRWIYGRGEGDRGDARQLLLSGYTQLCRTYGIWQMSPRDLFIPLDCSDEDKETLSAQDYLARLSWKQERFRLDTVTLEDAFDSTVAIESVIAYVVATYGHKALPTLISALDRHTSVDSLIPAVFGISTAEFEIGWRTHLVEQVSVK